jgi:hypothetical protein
MANKTLTWTTEETRTRAVAGHGVFDSKGRELGHLLVIHTEMFVFPDGVMVKIAGIFGKLHSVRNGKRFGSTVSNAGSFASIDEAKAALEKKAVEFGKKIAAKADKNGGIYK